DDSTPNRLLAGKFRGEKRLAATRLTIDQDPLVVMLERCVQFLNVHQPSAQDLVRTIGSFGTQGRSTGSTRRFSEDPTTCLTESLCAVLIRQNTGLRVEERRESVLTGDDHEQPAERVAYLELQRGLPFLRHPLGSVRLW